MVELSKLSRPLQFALLVGIFLVLCFTIPASDGNYLWRLPSLIAGWPAALNGSVEYMMFEWFPIETYNPDIEDYEESAFLKEITRSFSGFILFGIQFIRELLLGGVKTIVAFTSWDFVSENEWAVWPALPWTVVVAGSMVLGYALNGKGLAIFVGAALAYIGIFGQWVPAMETLSFVLIAAPVSVLLGVAFGIWAYKSKTTEAVLMPLLNVAQTMPHFSYLVPVTVFFGLGDHAGAIATIIFATPPMVRLTLLGLKGVSPEVQEAGVMNGCNKFQLLFKVMLPSARQNILVGVNQVIMQCLAMAVIASLIGAKGLGFNLLLALNQLRVGQALELGICIVLIAITLDKLSLSWANKQIDYFADHGFVERHKYSLIVLGFLGVGIVLAYLGTFIFGDKINYFYLIPHNKGITTEWFWQAGVDWMVDTWQPPIKLFTAWLFVNFLTPMKNAYLAMPVLATFVLFMGIGYIVGGIRSALTVGAFTLFLALTEWWDRALITLYMATVGVVISVIIGTSMGVLCAQNERATNVALRICDTLQTFPSFIYLIPVMMLFGVNDSAVLIAVIIYATIPALRYTVEGLINVPQALQDAGSMSGVNRTQRLLNIEIPLAIPHMMLGINQTVIFALFMVMIGALIATDDLGQLILKSLSDQNGIGNGLMLGLCVAFIGLAVDHIIQTWAKDRRAALGLG